MTTRIAVSWAGLLALGVVGVVSSCRPDSSELPVVSGADDRCESNLRQIGVALARYAQDDAKELYPPLSQRPGDLMFPAELLYPNYIASGLMVSPFYRPAEAELTPVAEANPTDVIGDQSYWYLGFMIPNERSGLEWIQAYRQHMPKGEAIPGVTGVWDDAGAAAPQEQRQVNSSGSSDASVDLGGFRTYMPLRNGIERFLVTDIANPGGATAAMAYIPILIERPELHGDGGHVLYLDGHVEFVRYPGKFPMTERFIEGLRSLDAL